MNSSRCGVEAAALSPECYSDVLTPNREKKQHEHLSKNLARHLTQTLQVLLRLLVWVSCDSLQLRAILCMPLLVLLLTLGSVCLASSIHCHVKCFHLVHIVVVHAALGEDILAPSTPLPIASVIGTWSKLCVALLQVRGEHPCTLPADDLEVAEETVLDILAILQVEPVWCITPDGVAQVHPQSLGNEDRIWVHLDRVVCLVYHILLLQFQPDLVEQTPIHPALGLLALDLVELAIVVLDRDGCVATEVN